MAPLKEIEPIIVDSTDTCLSAIKALVPHQTLFVDCEGNNLSRYGELYTVQIYVKDGGRRVFLFNVFAFPTAFDVTSERGESLRSLLTSRRLVMFDPRNDVDALWNMYQIMPQNVCCLQLAEAAIRKARFGPPRLLAGLGKCIDNYCSSSTTLKERQIKQRVSDSLKAKTFTFSDFKITKDTTQEILIYSCIDAICLAELEQRTWSLLNPVAKDWVIVESKKRCEMAKRFVPLSEMNSRDRCLPPRFTY